MARRAWIVTGLLSAGLLVAPALPAAAVVPDRVPASVPRSLPAATATTTAVVLKVKGCNGCTIGVQRAISFDSRTKPHQPEYWNGPSTTVRNGRAVLRVPTAYTRGMSFTLIASWEVNRNAVPNIVTRIAGKRAGQRVTGRAVARATKATACWAGTSRSKVVLRVTVKRFRAQGLGGEYGWASRSYMSPMVRSVSPLQATDDGTLANQEAFYC
jgi:hypothetical protein